LRRRAGRPVPGGRVLGVAVGTGPRGGLRSPQRPVFAILGGVRDGSGISPMGRAG
jgi:hypothetical protein